MTVHACSHEGRRGMNGEVGEGRGTKVTGHGFVMASVETEE